MSGEREPRYTCGLCGYHVVVRQDGRGFPPDIAKRRLRKNCAERDCQCSPRYTAGIGDFSGVASVVVSSTDTPTP